MITGVVIWPSAPILWFEQQGLVALSSDSSVAGQLKQCLVQMRQTWELVGAFDRVLIVGPLAPRPVGDRADRLGEHPVVAPVDEQSPAHSLTDPLAEVDPNWSLPTSITARLVRGFGYAGPIDAIEVGIRPAADSAGVPVTTADSLSTARKGVIAAAKAIDAACGTAGRTLLLAVGDGAAAHGDRAPLARDDRSQEYDESVHRAINLGQPAQLLDALAVDDRGCPLGLRLGSLGFWPMCTVAALDLIGQGTVHFDAAPLGVGYQVGTWIPSSVSQRPAIS